MNYTETIDWLYNQLPFYQNEGHFAYKKNINNVVKFFNKHGRDYLSFDTIHVGGTNGKGSVSHMLSSILQEAGLKVGLFTSPHLVDFRERIKINHSQIDKHFIVHFVQDYMQDFLNLKMSFFEMNVVMAFHYFKQKSVDIAIIEVGLGGRLDATNVICPKLSIITNISIDHTNLLGNSLDSIAKEKAGIIKKNTPVLIGEKNKRMCVFKDFANAMNADLFYAKDVDYCSDLKGSYQVQNINTCVTALNILRSQGIIVSEQNIIKGLKTVVANTGILGRWQIISNEPLTICDIAHNVAALRYVWDALNLHEHNKHIILGFSKDKDLEAIISDLPKNYKYYICGSPNPRILDPSNMFNLFDHYNLNYKTYDFVYDAYDDVALENSIDNLIMITGSTFIVSDILKYLDKV